MLVSDKDAIARLNSPMNLINRLKSIGSSNSSMNLFGLNGKNKKDEVKVTKVREVTFQTPVFANPFEKQNESESLELVRSESAKTLDPSSESSNNPSVDNLLNNATDQIKLSLAETKAIHLLDSAVETLRTKLDDIKPDKLPSVITAASKMITDLRKERIEANKSKQGNEVHLHFYTPTQKKVEDYDVIEVG